MAYIDSSSDNYSSPEGKNGVQITMDMASELDLKFLPLEEIEEMKDEP